MITMGSNEVIPSPKTSYKRDVYISPSFLIGFTTNGCMGHVPHDLEARVAPLLEIYTRILGEDYLVHLHLDNRGYGGIFEDFKKDDKAVHGTPVYNLYYLFLDRLHSIYNFLSRKVSINNNSFQFIPTQYFFVYGTVIESGTLNDFDYYFVRV